jgi:hypothetical protein
MSCEAGFQLGSAFRNRIHEGQNGSPKKKILRYFKEMDAFHCFGSGFMSPDPDPAFKAWIRIFMTRNWKKFTAGIKT